MSDGPYGGNHATWTPIYTNSTNPSRPTHLILLCVNEQLLDCGVMGLCGFATDFVYRSDA